MGTRLSFIPSMIVALCVMAVTVSASGHIDTPKLRARFVVPTEAAARDEAFKSHKREASKQPRIDNYDELRSYAANRQRIISQSKVKVDPTQRAEAIFGNMRTSKGGLSANNGRAGPLAPASKANGTYEKHLANASADAWESFRKFYAG